MVRQGIAERKLGKNEMNSFFVTLRRLAESHGRLPDSMITADSEKVETSDKVLASGGFADVKRGRSMGRFVAVKTVGVAAQDDFMKIR